MKKWLVALGFSFPLLAVMPVVVLAPFMAAARPAGLPTGSGGSGTSASGPPMGLAGGSAYSLADIPSRMLQLYMAAAPTCPGLAWEVLAGIGKVETDHGRNTSVSSAGAEGPMQFMPATWAIYGIEADGDGVADILDPVDAVFSAARYLCANGAGDPARLYSAVWNYNHSDAYVGLVLSIAARYAQDWKARQQEFAWRLPLVHTTSG